MIFLSIDYLFCKKITILQFFSRQKKKNNKDQFSFSCFMFFIISLLFLFFLFILLKYSNLFEIRWFKKNLQSYFNNKIKNMTEWYFFLFITSHFHSDNIKKMILNWPNFAFLLPKKKDRERESNNWFIIFLFYSF